MTGRPRPNDDDWRGSRRRRMGGRRVVMRWAVLRVLQLLVNDSELGDVAEWV